MTNYLLVTGESTAGKNTTIDIIVDRLVNVYHVPATIIHTFAFGDKLKQITSELFDVPLELINGPHKEKYRPLVQKTADTIKSHHQLFFTNLALSSFTPLALNICTDWRFDYEYNQILAMAASKIKTVRLLRNFQTKGNHNSERTLDSFKVDLSVDNTNLSPETTAWQILKRMEIWFPDIFNY